jgi:hypothetical protein
MMRRGQVQHLLLALVLLCPVPTYAAQIESGPTAVPCREPFSILRNGLFNFGEGPVRLKDGRGCVKARPEDPRCDWSVALTRAERWGAGGQLVLVVINRNHEVGSGAFDSVFWYACERGTLVPVWSHSYLYGATIVMGQESDLWITSGVWRPGDSTCCPSQERREHLAWNGATRSVALRGSEVTARRGQR